AARVLGERAPAELRGALRLTRAGEQAGLRRDGLGPRRAAQDGGGPLPAPGGLERPAARLQGACAAGEGPPLPGARRERFLEVLQCELGVAEALDPDVPDVAQKSCPLLGGHLERELELGDLQRDVEALPGAVQPAQRGEGGAMTRLGVQRRAEAGLRA